MSEQDYDLAISCISKINRSAKEIFNEAYNKNCFVYKYIYENKGVEGIFCVIEMDNFFVSQISFSNDFNNENVITYMTDTLSDIIEKKGNKDFYLNINGNNQEIISYFWKRGFSNDATGIQYKYILKSSDKDEIQESILLDELEFRGYEEQYADQYIDLRDEAFNPLDTACGNKPDANRRNKEKVLEWLRDSDKEDNFGTFWLQGELVGLYVLYNDYLNSLAIHPKFQNKGYGSRILKFCINKMLNDKKYIEIYLNCLIQNKDAHKFYIKNGFEKCGFYSENTYRSLEADK